MCWLINKLWKKENPNVAPVIPPVNAPIEPKPIIVIRGASDPNPPPIPHPWMLPGVP
ncbi:hypothetical protein GM3708_1416 [Geminocystis sp. NIES-3708]|nr:hypothetical protein GM3708_1416 [Geminocystis sp. NIES-3708]